MKHSETVCGVENRPERNEPLPRTPFHITLRRWKRQLRWRLQSLLLPTGVPPQIREAIDHVALFVTQMEEDYYGEFGAHTEVSEAVCDLISWAFPGNTDRDSRFVAYLENRIHGDCWQELMAEEG